MPCLSEAQMPCDRVQTKKGYEICVCNASVNETHFFKLIAFKLLNTASIYYKLEHSIWFDSSAHHSLKALN